MIIEKNLDIIYQLDLSPITKSTQPTEQKLKRKFSGNSIFCITSNFNHLL
jgi:hypothetical protein